MKKIVPIALLILITSGASFFVGMEYQKKKIGFTPNDFQNMRNLSPEDRQNFAQNRGGEDGARFGRTAGAGFVTGEIINKDDQSLTIKLADGGTKIVFFSDTTTINKMAEGVKDDLQNGENIIVNGSANDDGSLTAESIQLRPENQPQPQ